MADELNKDVVGARINLDTTKILPAFKIIDEGAKQNAASFKTLNAELAVTAKNYETLAKSADKLALTADERRNKILEESKALVAQRVAQAELAKAKTQQLDVTNQVVDSKLKAQQAIQKQRENSIEQQEKEHQQRMATLQQKTAVASGQDNLMQAKLEREFQQLKIGDARLEMEAERHAARMNQMVSGSSTNGALNRSSQYLIAGTMYYSAIQGAKEAISVIKDFEYSLVSVQRVMGQNADIGFIKQSMINDAKEYGYAIKDVADVYIQIAQQGFSEKETAALAKTALMAANVEESFNGAAQAQQLLTGAILNYNMAATDSERLLDRINQVSNDYATDSNKLLQGINAVGAAAHNAGEPIDLLIGQLTVLNQAGFSGSEAGNALKSFISFSTRDIAVNKLREYVGEIKQANGQMMPFSEILGKVAEKWRTLSDVQRNEVTQAIARGNQASKFVALMDNYDQVLKAATTSENSFGSAQRENALAMTTLEKQSLQLKAAWDELVVSMGDSGLLGVIKEVVHTGTLLVDGFNSLPEPIRNTLAAVLVLGGAIVTLNTGMRILTGQSIIQLVSGMVAGARAMMGMKVATDAATISQRAFIATPIGAVLAGIALAIGVATTAWSYFKGSVNEASDATVQNDRDTFALTQKYKDLKAIVDDNTKSDKEIKQAKDELAGVITRISNLMPELVAQWDAHGQAIDLNIQKIDEFSQKYAESMRIVETDNVTKLTKKRDDLQTDIQLLGVRQYNVSDDSISFFDKYIRGITVDSKVVDINKQILDKGKELEGVTQQLKNSQDTLDLLDGKTTAKPKPDKTHTGPEDPDQLAKDRKDNFDGRMAEFRHQVNIEAKGYTDAKQQLAKLRAIRAEFGSLSDTDLYGIDEDIHRLSIGKKITTGGGGGGPNPTKKAFDDFNNAVQHRADLGQLTTEQELAMWKKAETAFASTQDLRWQAEEKVHTLEMKLQDDKKKKEQDVFSTSENWISHKKALGELSLQEEYDAWLRVQSRYLTGTEERKKADEQVYAAKQALVQEEEKNLDDLVKKEKSSLEQAKQAELDRIDKAKQDYVDAQDAKIKALDDLMQAEDQANANQDYTAQLKDKQDRLGVLQSAVGPDGIKERKQVILDIADMEQKHQRDLTKQAQTAEKQRLEDDKAAKQKEFDQQKTDAENHYKDLLGAFDNFSNDVAGRADLLKNVQIQKDSEKNAEILKNLDTFVTDYQTKMASIAGLSKTQAQVDFDKYTENQRVFNDPKSTAAQKKSTNAENIAFRNQYGISQTNYAGIQHFADGGVVQGRRGDPVPTISHAGEMYLNEKQQSNLFRLLDFKMPQLNFSMPQFTPLASGSHQTTITHHHVYDMSVDNVNLHDQSDERTFFSERDSQVRRIQVRTGAKQR